MLTPYYGTQLSNCRLGTGCNDGLTRFFCGGWKCQVCAEPFSPVACLQELIIWVNVGCDQKIYCLYPSFCVKSISCQPKELEGTCRKV